MPDLILRGGKVYDGLGAEPVEADVAVAGGRIVGVGGPFGPATRVLDVGGLSVAPGFIDPHAHSDAIPFLDDPQPFKLLQGVTTEIVGNCGFSLAPLTAAAVEEAEQTHADIAAGVDVVPCTFADYLRRVAQAGPTNHLAALVGHNTLRLSANGPAADISPASDVTMGRLAAEAFAAGAIGLSTGLLYPPGTFATTDEVVRLALIARQWQRPYTSHIRDEGRLLAESLDEAGEIGRRARIRVQISHCKAAGRDQKGQSQLLLDRLYGLRLDGVDIRGDLYPYCAGATGLSALLPAAAHDGGVNGLRALLADADARRHLRQLAETGRDAGRGQWSDVTPADILVTSHADGKHVGRTLADVAAGADEWDTLCDVLLADPAASMVISFIDEGDMVAIMADPLISIGSDNGPPSGLQHPRTWGCFPRFLGSYVRERGVVSWPEAIRKMTSSVADQFGLVGRGWIGPGALADICVFDEETVGHEGTYLRPDPAPTGIEHVLLNGAPVVVNGRFTGVRHGQVLTGGGRVLEPPDR